jgi:DNA-binding NarL/FixJ family response regulator
MSQSAPIRVFSVDDQPLIRGGIAALINSEPDMHMIAQAWNGHDAIQKFRQHRPDVTLMDVRLPDISGIEAVIAIRSEFPDARIVMLTTFEGDVEIRGALAAGAQGYVLKHIPPGELAGVIRRVHGGKKQIPADVAARLAEHLSDEPLSERELTVLERVAEGRRNREIGELLGISEETVKGHVKHIMEKLDVHDRSQAVVIAVRRGIIRL